MSAERASRSELDDAVAAIYGGPPDEFVSRRDALAKELRTERRREDAAAIRRLRKPKRLAWALDAAVLNDSESIERVDAAVNDTLVAQSAGGDPREAFGQLRRAVSDLADAAVQAAAGHGHGVEHADLVQAVLAVIGVSEALDALRAGRLVDIPAAGALDLLTTIASSGIAREPAAPTGTAQPARTARPARTAKPDTAAAHDAVRRADTVLASARDRAAAAERALRSAEAKLKAAEEQLKRAERELNDRRAELEHSRRVVDAAATKLRDAEREAEQARARLEQVR